ncbi:MAG: hypothetical protein RLZZ574_873 [Cyanobacteriota bacterium]|jgi:hypothetical protein
MSCMVESANRFKKSQMDNSNHHRLTSGETRAFPCACRRRGVARQNTCNVSVESKGFCFYKATNGIKRHLAVDSLGFPAWCIFSHCTSANVSDDQGLIEMLSVHINYFQSKPVNIILLIKFLESTLL